MKMSALEDLAQALAENGINVGSFTCWPGSDCPWFIPGPSAAGLPVESFEIAEYEG